MNILFLLLTLGTDDQLGDLRILKTYEPPGADAYISLGYTACFARDGRLFLLDASQTRILVWRADGSFERAFGSKGEGPGELQRPIQLDAFGDSLFVWQANGRISRFDFSGQFQDLFTITGAYPRRMRILNQETLLIGFRETRKGGKVYYGFELRDRRGNLIREVKDDHNIGFLGMGTGSNNAAMYAFMADIDIQRRPNGELWYGFGYERDVFRMNKLGETLGHRRFEIPTGPPSESEKAWFGSQEISTPSGGVVKLDELPNLKIHYDHDKAFFTKFWIKGPHIAFILTSHGGTDGIGHGDNWGTYVVNELATGKQLTHGRYLLPEDSQVYYRDGRAITVLMGEDGEVTVHETTLRGM